MVNRVGVAGSALGGCAFVDIILVAGGAFHAHMRAIEREAAQAVVEGRVLPVAGMVAGFACRAILPLVSVILLVTGVAIFWRARIALGMAGFALHVNMLTFEREIAQAVVKFGRLPGFGGVTDATLVAQIPLVNIIF